MRRAALLCAIAMVLQVTALFLVWWTLTFSSQGIDVTYGRASLWGQGGGIASDQRTWITGALAAIPIAILFVRVAGSSWKHEPKAWRRDIAIAAGFMLAALASALTWPLEFPFFWGGRSYAGNATVEPYSITGTPGLGWWLTLAAVLLTAWAWLLSRRRRETPEA